MGVGQLRPLMQLENTQSESPARCWSQSADVAQSATGLEDKAQSALPRFTLASR